MAVARPGTGAKSRLGQQGTDDEFRVLKWLRQYFADIALVGTD